MLIKNILEIDDIFNSSKGKVIAITTHVNPDGDGLATALALYYCLKNVYSANPYIIMDSSYPTFLDFLNYKDCKITSFMKFKEEINKIDLLVVLDCHEEDRVDTDTKIFSLTEKVLVIDHHIAKEDSMKENYFYYIDSDAVSAGLMLHRIIRKSKITNYISRQAESSKNQNTSFLKDYVDCIYTSILNDTDNFVNSNAKKETFLVVAELIEWGLETHKVVNPFLNRKSILYYKYIGEVLSTISLNDNMKIVSYYSTLKMLKNNNQTLDSYSKMMRWTKGAFDVDVQVLFQEHENNLWKISLRSDLYDMSKIAHHFGGGGHIKASGFQIIGNFESIKQTVIKYIESQIS